MIISSQAFDLMEILSKEETSYLENTWVLKKIPKNGRISCANDSTTKRIFWVKEGFLKVLDYTSDGDENIKYLVKSGNIFGELSLAGIESLEDYAEAILPSIVYAIPLAEIQYIIGKNQQLQQAIKEFLGYRILKLEQLMGSLKFHNSQSRIIEFLQDYARCHGKEEGRHVVTKNLLTHKEIASITGTSRPFVTKIFNELKGRGILEYNKEMLIFQANALAVLRYAHD